MSAAQIGAEPYQRVSHIVKQRLPGRVSGGGARHQDVIHSRQPKIGQKLACGLPEAAARPVAGDRPADLSARCKADPNGPGVRPAARLDHHIGPRRLDAMADKHELRPLAQALNDKAMGGRTRANEPYAERRLRPLARRRDSTFWPPLVAIRARKPWRRFRTSRLG